MIKMVNGKRTPQMKLASIAPKELTKGEMQLGPGKLFPNVDANVLANKRKMRL